MLKIENVVKTFHEKKILDSVSLSVKSGEIALLLGSSGVGKSTLLRILNNLETIDSGTIILNGEPLDLNLVNKTHKVGMVFQQFNLFDHLTVQENIILALEKVVHKSTKEATAIASKLLDRYNLSDKKDIYPHKLSGGQKQRVALARAIALTPHILCLDEPTSALDPLFTSHVAATIQTLAQEGYIIVVASHDIGLLEKLNCTIHLMDGGKIIEIASCQDFKKNPNLYPKIHNFVLGTL